MISLLLGLGFVLSFLAAYLLVPPTRRLALRAGWLDWPDGKRKVHTNPIPRTGGLAIVGGFALGMAFLWGAWAFLSTQGELPLRQMGFPPIAFFLGGLAMALVGLYDDAREINFKWKFAAQIIVAYLMIYAGYRIEIADLFSDWDDAYLHAWWSIPLTLLWYVGVMNAVNLMDGLDGLAAGISIIALLSMAAAFSLGGNIGIVVVAMVAAGATAGFLAHNFHPATIFMGDCGSLFLGFLLATYALMGVGALGDEALHIRLVPLLAMGLPVLDVNLAIARRLLERKSLFAADRDHIHHRLLRRFSFSQRRTVLTLYVLGTVFGLAAVLLAAANLTVGVVILSVIACSTYFLVRALGYLRLEDATAFVQAHRRNAEPAETPSAPPADAPSRLYEPEPSSGDGGGPRESVPELEPSASLEQS